MQNNRSNTNSNATSIYASNKGPILSNSIHQQSKRKIINKPLLESVATQPNSQNVHNSSVNPQANKAAFNSNLDVNGSVVATSGRNNNENRLVQNSTGA